MEAEMTGMRTSTIRLDPTVEDNMTGCPCGKLIDQSNGYEADVDCWRAGPQPDGIGITVNTDRYHGREIAYMAMAEVVSGWPMQEFHIYYEDAYEHITYPEDSRP